MTQLLLFPMMLIAVIYGIFYERWIDNYIATNRLAEDIQVEEP